MVLVKTISVILVISMVFYCCTATRRIPPQKSDYEKLNEQLQGKKGEIVLKNNDIILGENIALGIDSTSYYEEGDSLKAVALGKEPDKKIIATSEIEKITLFSRGQGARDGFWYGALAGAASGIVVILINVAEDPPNNIGRAGLAVIGAILVYGFMGAIIGLPIGFIVGGTDEYVLTDVKTDSIDNSIGRNK